MRVLVTGATGFVGAAALRALAAEGWTHLALVRSPEAAAAVASAGAEPVRGDLADPGSLSLPPIDAVLHLAAHFRLAGPAAPYRRINVDGTAALLAAAAAAGARRFVHLSAGAVVMDAAGSPLALVDETAPTHPHSPYPYVATKAEGEARVIAADRPGFRTVALRPPMIWGRGDMLARTLPAMLRRRQFAFVGGGRYPCSAIHVDNVAEAAVAALRVGDVGAGDVGGRAFFVADRETTTFRALVEALARALGLSAAGAPSVPYGLAHAAGGAMEAVWRGLGRAGDPPLSRTMVRLIGRAFTVDDRAARAALGYVGHTDRAAGLARYA